MADQWRFMNWTYYNDWWGSMKRLYAVMDEDRYVAESNGQAIRFLTVENGEDIKQILIVSRNTTKENPYAR